MIWYRARLLGCGSRLAGEAVRPVSNIIHSVVRLAPQFFGKMQ